MGPLPPLSILSHSPEETQRLGEMLGRLAQPGDVLLLCGDLGSGKTCLTQGIARGLGVQDSVRSPTFVLATEHAGRVPLYHIDLYRIEDPREVEGLGLDDYIEDDGVCVVEWADKAISYFPKEHLLIELEPAGEHQRRIRRVARGPRYAALLEKLRPHVQKLRRSS